MNFYQLKAFYIVAESGSFTTASRVLFITQPAVSHQIRALESYLGVKLLNRGGRKVTLTREGVILYEYAKRIFSLMDEAKASLRRSQDLAHGSVSMGATGVAGIYFLPDIISDFKRMYPDTRLSIQIGNARFVMEKLAEGEIEMGILPVAAAPPRRMKRILFRSERLLLVCGRQCPLYDKKNVQVDDLEGVQFIFREKGTQNRIVVDKWVQKIGLRLKKSVELGHMEAVKELLKGGMGVSFMPEVTVREEIEQGVLKKIDLPGLDLRLDYYIMYNNNTDLSSAVRAFLRMLESRGAKQETLAQYKDRDSETDGADEMKPADDCG